MPPNIHFDHVNINLNPALNPSTNTPKIGVATSITITLKNDGNQNGTARVYLWWVGPAGTGSAMSLLPKLLPPDTTTNPIPMSVPKNGGTATKTVRWAPAASDFPTTPVSGYLFAQATVDPIPPTYPGDNSAVGNWNPSHPTCARHDITVIP